MLGMMALTLALGSVIVEHLFFILSQRPIAFVIALIATIKIRAKCKAMLALSF